MWGWGRKSGLSYKTQNYYVMAAHGVGVIVPVPNIDINLRFSRSGLCVVMGLHERGDASRGQPEGYFISSITKVGDSTRHVE